jgi:hypothetical protein
MVLSFNRDYYRLSAIWLGLLLGTSSYADGLAPPKTPPPAPGNGSTAGGTADVQFGNSPVQVGTQGEFPWSGSDSKDCGQACLNHKSAEEIALMTMYQLQVTSAVENLDFSDKNTNKVNDEKYFDNITNGTNGTNGFCNGGEDRLICRKRFLEYQYSYLLQLRHAEAENKVNAGKYMSQSGALYNRKTKDANDKPKKAQVPYVATVSDLEIEFKKHDKMKREEIDGWRDSVHRRDPLKKEEDFYEYEAKNNDPKKKESGKITVRVMAGERQQVNLDYQKRANAKYQGLMSDGKSKEEVDKFSKRLDIRAADPKIEKLETAAGKERIKLFNEARSKVVKTVNDAIFGAGIKTTVDFSTGKPTVQLKKNEHIDINEKIVGKVKSDPRNPASVPVATGMERVDAIEPSSENEDSFVTIGWDPQKLQQQIDEIKYPN